MYHMSYDPPTAGSSSSAPVYQHPYNYDMDQMDEQYHPNHHPQQSHSHSAGYPNAYHADYPPSGSHSGYNEHSGSNHQAQNGAGQNNSMYPPSEYAAPQYWSFNNDPSSSRQAEQDYRHSSDIANVNGEGGWGTGPSPGIVPPLPTFIEHAVSDNALLNMQHWGPFSTLDTSGPTRNTAIQSQHFDLTSFIEGHLVPPAVFQPNGTETDPAPENVGKAQNGYGFDAVPHLMANRHDSTPTPGSEHSHINPPSQLPTPGTIYRDVSIPGTEGKSVRKGKERAAGLDTPEETKPLRGEGHNEFDKDIALVGDQAGARRATLILATNILDRPGWTATTIRYV